MRVVNFIDKLKVNCYVPIYVVHFLKERKRRMANSPNNVAVPELQTLDRTWI